MKDCLGNEINVPSRLIDKERRRMQIYLNNRATIGCPLPRPVLSDKSQGFAPNTDRSRTDIARAKRKANPDCDLTNMELSRYVIHPGKELYATTWS